MAESPRFGTPASDFRQMCVWHGTCPYAGIMTSIEHQAGNTTGSFGLAVMPVGAWYTGYVSRPIFFKVDQNDPRAPAQELWDRLTAEQRRAVVAALPSEIPLAMPEGDYHRVPKEKARESLSEHFRRLGRRVYLSSELPVYYPDEDMFAPDLIAVLDVETHQRDKWVKSEEGKGVDLVLEITFAGNRRKDLKENVARYARLGIPEYFVLDARDQRLTAYRLERPGGSSYQAIVPQGGRWPSEVLGLDLAVEDRRVRFYHGSEPLPAADELIARLTTMVDELLSREEDLERQLQTERRRVKEEARRRQAERRRAEKAEQRAEQEQQRAERLAARLRELGEDPES